MKVEMNKFISELHKDRQLEMLHSFYLYFGMTVFNIIFVYILRETEGTEQSLIILLITLLIPISFVCGIYLTYKKVKGYLAFDRVVIVLAVFFSMFSQLFGTNVLLSVTTYMPVFLFLVFSTMNKKYFLIYILITIVHILFGFFKFGYYSYTVNIVNYVTVFMSMITILIIASRLIQLFNRYVKNITTDYLTLQDKNMELGALNEEYYATQEELFEKYDEVSQLNENNKKLAFYDSLTGLPNRMHFMQSIEEVLLHKEHEGYILFADINRFKDINSVYSYVIGDQVLIEVANRLSALPFKLNTVARMSGDLFSLIIEEAVDEAVLLKALNNINGNLTINHYDIALQMNYGILKLHNQTYTNSKILQSIDAALNRAKEQRHEHVFFFNHSLIEEIEKRVTMENALKKAISDGVITTVFQPVVNTLTQQTIGYETLARWTDPVLGHISPQFFIKHAEESGLIIPLGEMILEQACQFIVNLRKSGAKAFVTVNLSSIQLLQENVVNKMLRIIDASGVFYDEIGFEVTETDLIRDFEIAVHHLKMLKDRGIKIYLDDFGTGYSSLNYISLLPIDVLKIDRDFITNIHKDSDKQTMLKIIIELANQYHLSMVAEGVEILEEYEYLKEKGIQMIQGFYFSRPQNATVFTED